MTMLSKHWLCLCPCGSEHVSSFLCDAQPYILTVHQPCTQVNCGTLNASLGTPASSDAWITSTTSTSRNLAKNYRHAGARVRLSLNIGKGQQAAVVPILTTTSVCRPPATAET